MTVPCDEGGAAAGWELGRRRPGAVEGLPAGGVVLAPAAPSGLATFAAVGVSWRLAGGKGVYKGGRAELGGGGPVESFAGERWGGGGGGGGGGGTLRGVGGGGGPRGVIGGGSWARRGGGRVSGGGAGFPPDIGAPRKGFGGPGRGPGGRGGSRETR